MECYVTVCGRNPMMNGRYFLVIQTCTEEVDNLPNIV